jgi:septal ring factor EnvC (AmiA/AmiB activator)
MKRASLRFEFILAVFVLFLPLRALAQNQDYLTSEEVNKLRDAQDPSERIKVYLSFQQDRLSRMEAAINSNGDTRDNFDELLNEYISIDNELKDWIQYQYDHDGDMRKGLRALLDEGPKQLEVLRHFQSSGGAEAKTDSSSLRDAIADMSDTLDGATQALAAQDKKFPEMKATAKAEERELKMQRKEQEKLNKKERKMRNKQRKKENSDDSSDQ